MVNKTKLTLSAFELQFAEDTQWILTKQRITDSVYHLFNEQVPVIKQCFLAAPGHYPQEILAAVPKISKGENYKGLPYVLMDFPSVFEKEQVFAFRSMFWWGNFFSVTLQLSGKYKDLFAARVNAGLLNSAHDLFICVNNDCWEHHFELSNYVPIKNVDKQTLSNLVNEKAFIKIACKHPLRQWNSIEILLKDSYKILTDLLVD